MKVLKRALSALISAILIAMGGAACANEAPVANAGDDATVAAGEGCIASVTLDASKTTDPDSDVLTYTWTGPFTEGAGTATGVSVNVTLPKGASTITLTVDDGNGHVVTDTVVITVEDQTPPEVTISASPKTLWPPNHKMVPVTLTVTVTDNCSTGEEVTSKITKITSDEPDNGIGDGNTTGDFEITGDLTANLRAERQGPGDGRVYTLTVESTDAAGNVTSTDVLVKVPHDMGGDDDDDCGLEAGDFTTFSQASWGAPAAEDNAGAYLAAHFATVFPDGVTVGAGAAGVSGATAKFTTADAIAAFLPQVGAPAAFVADYIDPLTTEAGSLAGEVLVLTLNVKFDLADPEFSKSSTSLKDLVFVKAGSPCDGKTVQQILDTANTVLGGGTSDVSAQDINDCVTLINGNFEDGKINGGFLKVADCTLLAGEIAEAPKALKDKGSKLHSKLLHIYDKDHDGKLKGKEKSKLRKYLKTHKPKKSKKK
jgi:hypothetical protein